MNEVKKEIVYDGDTSFLKLGNKIFTVELVSEDGMEIENKITAYHQQVLSDTVKELYSSQTNENYDEWNTQLSKLSEIEQSNATSGILKLNMKEPRFRNATFMENNGYLMLVKTIKYSPNIFRGTKNYVNGSTMDAIYEGLEANGGNRDALPSVFEIKFDTEFSRDIIVGTYISGPDRRVHTPGFRTFHTLGSWKVCEGSYNGGLWTGDTAELTRRINEVNLDSLGSSSLYGVDAYGTSLDSINIVNYLNNASNFSIIQSGW